MFKIITEKHNFEARVEVADPSVDRVCNATLAKVNRPLQLQIKTA